MSEIEQIVEELTIAFEGEPWHGPALMEIVAGVDAKAASAHPIAEAHSIWELVLHIAAWERAINTRIVQRKALQLNDEENFPTVTDASEAAWRQAIEKLRKDHRELVATTSGLSGSQLSAQVPGKPYDVRFMLHGAAQHVAYHGGQIALLKKALSKKAMTGEQ
jgi:uncharacterized damage-inducible protein DinB